MNEFIHSISKNNQRVISTDDMTRTGSRTGSRLGASDPFEESFEVRGRENVTEDIRNAFRGEGLPGIVKDISATSQAGTNICNKLASKWNCSTDAAEIIFDTVVNG